MGTGKIGEAALTDMKTNVADYKVARADEEQEFWDVDWVKWKGYYDTIPEVQAVIDAKARWTVGKGFKADDKTKEILSKIRGSGKDTFNSIMNNAVRVYTIGGDFFAEIIRDARGKLINLKPLSPGMMRILATNKGIIKGYEQRNKTGTDQTPTVKWKTKEIFHLPWQKLADAIHGIGTIAKVENIILMRNEAMTDMKTVFHRYVKPLLIIPVKTDDAAEIAAFKTKVENSVKHGENMIIPEDVAEKIERVSIPQYSTLDPLPWLTLLQQFFIQAEGVPEVILGYGRDTTEASSKILYLAFQQMVEFNQLFLEEQIEAQLGLKVEFEFPARLDENLAEDQRKDGPVSAVKKSEVTATL